MTIGSFLDHYGIALSIPVFVLGVFLLILCITGLVKTVRKAKLFSMPLRDRQEITFPEAGRVVLAMEGPLLTQWVSTLNFELTGPDGRIVKNRPVLFRLRTTGLKKTRIELKIYEITCPGRHIFQITCFQGDNPSNSPYQLVFTRPHLKTVILYILGLVTAGNFMVWSLVLFLMRIFSAPGSF